MTEFCAMTMEFNTRQPDNPTRYSLGKVILIRNSEFGNFFGINFIRIFGVCGVKEFHLIHLSVTLDDNDNEYAIDIIYEIYLVCRAHACKMCRCFEFVC